MTIVSKIIFSVLIISLSGCAQNYDPELEQPDGHHGGYNLTQLGLLLYTPFIYRESSVGFNVQIFNGDRELSSIGVPYSDLQKELVFEFHRNGTLSYWFKKDYIHGYMDTITLSNGQKSLSHTLYHSDQLGDKVKRIYATGSWHANFKDSSLKIDFGKNNFSLLPFVGRYTYLGVGGMALEQTFVFDSLVNGKHETFKKVINTYFEEF